MLGRLLAKHVWKSIFKRPAAVLVDVLTYRGITPRETQLKLVSKCVWISCEKKCVSRVPRQNFPIPRLDSGLWTKSFRTGYVRSVAFKNDSRGCDKRTRSYARRVSIAPQMFSTRRFVYRRMVLRWRVHRYRIRVSRECYSVCPGDSDHDFGANNKAECWTRRAHNKVRTTITINRV